jgi:hypothetical protein
MSIKGGPNLVTNGLVFGYDSSNPAKSYQGEPTTNLISTVNIGNATKNTYPDIGNGWGTYHVELYNTANYFDITGSGGVPVVTNNVVTCSNGHLFRTYSAVKPLTTGGGVTAGTLYYTRYMDSASFMLYPYTGSENIGITASLAGFVNNTPIIVNAASFPTLWSSPAHIANSTHIKEIIPNGYNGHSCIRVHHFRSSLISPYSGSNQHGMAYGITPTFTSGSTYTFSFNYRAANNAAIGKGISFQRYTNGDTSTQAFVIGPTWQKLSMTVTSSQTAVTALYWLCTDITSNFSYDISEIQVEQNTHATNFTPVSRSLSSSFYDITGNTNITGQNLVFDSTNQISYTSGTVLLAGSPAVVQPSIVTVEAVAKYTGVSQANAFIGGFGNTGTAGYWLGNYSSGLGLIFSIYAGSQYKQLNVANPTPNNTIQHIVGTYSASQQYLYVNGTRIVSDSTVSGSISYAGLTNGLIIGNIQGFSTARYWSGSIYMFRVYNRVLSPDEILQNYNAVQTKFGI